MQGMTIQFRVSRAFSEVCRHSLFCCCCQERVVDNALTKLFSALISANKRRFLKLINSLGSIALSNPISHDFRVISAPI